MSVSRRLIHHGLYFAVLGPLIGVLFSCPLHIFAKKSAGSWAIIHPIFSLIVDNYGAIPALLTGVMVACLPEKIVPPETLSLSGWWHRWSCYH